MDNFICSFKGSFSHNLSLMCIGSRDGRYAIYRATQKTIIIFALVSPCNCDVILLACGSGTKCQWTVVCKHEFICTLPDVLLLFPHSAELQAKLGPIRYHPSDFADGGWYHRCGILWLLQAHSYCSTTMPCTRYYCRFRIGDVRKLFGAVLVAVLTTLAGLREKTDQGGIMRLRITRMRSQVC